MSKFKLSCAGACVALFAQATMAGGIQSVTLDVTGMTCASCPLTVRKVLKGVPGVIEVSVDLKSESALVKFDSDRTQPGKLAKVVSEVGFPTVPRK